MTVPSSQLPSVRRETRTATVSAFSPSPVGSARRSLRCSTSNRKTNRTELFRSLFRVAPLFQGLFSSFLFLQTLSAMTTRLEEFYFASSDSTVLPRRARDCRTVELACTVYCPVEAGTGHILLSITAGCCYRRKIGATQCCSLALNMEAMSYCLRFRG